MWYQVTYFWVQLLQLQNYFCAHHFRNFFAFTVFTLTFHFATPRQAPVGDIWRLYDTFKDVVVVISIRLWDCGHYGSLWVHTSAVINILPGYGNINATIQTLEGEVVSITLSRYICLPELEDVWLNSGVRQIDVSAQNGFVMPIKCFTEPPISVVDNKVWTVCFVPVIRFLVILFSIGVEAFHLDSTSILLREVLKQVMNYLDVPALTVLLEFC